jgi:hypothetical protein
MKKKIAICIYGQARSYQDGFKVYQNIINNNSEYDFDFFYHTWFDENQDLYEVNLHREISIEERKIDKNLIENLNNIYYPKSFSYDKPIQFDLTEWNNLLIFKSYENLKEKSVVYNVKKTYKNNMSQIYSRNRLANLFKTYVDETNTNYDFVITSRFDIKTNINIKFNELNNTYIYTNNAYYPRRIICDVTIIMSPKKYVNIFNFDKIWNNIINSIELKTAMESINEIYYFNPEELITCSILYNGYLSDVIYTNKIPIGL